MKICLSFLRDSFLGTYLSYLHQEEDLFNYPPFLCPGSGARLMIRPKRSNHVPFRLFESNDVRFRLFESNDAVFDFFESNDVSFRLFESNDVSNLPDTVRYHGTSSVPRWEAGAKTPTPQFWLPNFSTGSPFAIIFRQPFLADQPQNFYKGAFGANITDFEGVAHAETEKKNVFWPVFEKFRKIKLVDLKRSHGSIFPIPAFQKGRGGGVTKEIPKNIRSKMSRRRTSNSRFTMPRNVSQNFSHEEMQRLNLRFRKLDKDHSGTLSVSELMVLPDIPKNKLIYRDAIAIAALFQTLSFFPIISKFCKVVLTTIFSGSHIEKIHKNGKFLTGFGR